MTVNRYFLKKLASAALAAAMTAAPACMLAAETAPQVPGVQAEQKTMERLSPFGKASACRGITVSQAWLRQARLGGVMLNLRLNTPMGDEVIFREMLKATSPDGMSLYLRASENSDIITMQMDQKAVDTLVRLGIDEVVVADADRYVRARYRVSELQAVRDALGLGAAEQLCVSGEQLPVSVVSEDGVRRQVN